MIQLSEAEKKFINLTKGQYQDVYPFKGSWVVTIKPLFEEIYGWNPNDDIRSYKNILFHKLLDIYFKIQNDGSGSHQELKGVFDVAFNKRFSRTERTSIDRAIAELCGILQCNQVIEDGVKRYNLDIKMLPITKDILKNTKSY